MVRRGMVQVAVKRVVLLITSLCGMLSCLILISSSVVPTSTDITSVAQHVENIDWQH